MVVVPTYSSGRAAVAAETEDEGVGALLVVEASVCGTVLAEEAGRSLAGGSPGPGHHHHAAGT